MKRTFIALIAGLALTSSAFAHDLNGGSWEPNEDLTQNAYEISQDLHLLDEYAITDAAIYVKHHPKPYGNYSEALYKIGVERAMNGHKLLDGKMLEAYANEFSFVAASFYDAK